MGGLSFTLEQADRFGQSRLADESFDLGDDLSAPVAPAEESIAMTNTDLGGLADIENGGGAVAMLPGAELGLTALAAESRAATGELRLSGEALLARLRRVAEGARGVLVDQPYLTSAPGLYAAKGVADERE